jgi:hypothetical protein
MAITLEGLGDWMDRYVGAWRSGDRAEIEALFTDDVRYVEHPYDPPFEGPAAVADRWLQDPDPPDSWRADYAPMLVAGDRGVASGTSTYFEDDGSIKYVFHNVFVLTLAETDGVLRCREYREWYMRQPKPSNEG